MAPDDTAGDASDATDGPTDTGRPDSPTTGTPGDLAARFSDPSRRAYGLERVPGPTDRGLLSARERQYLRQVHRLDEDDRDAVEDAVSERVGEFVDTDWPVIRQNCPEVAEALRAELCGSDD